MYIIKFKKYNSLPNPKPIIYFNIFPNQSTDYKTPKVIK